MVTTEVLGVLKKLEKQAVDYTQTKQQKQQLNAISRMRGFPSGLVINMSKSIIGVMPTLQRTNDTPIKSGENTLKESTANP
jgi:hypothetical protein